MFSFLYGTETGLHPNTQEMAEVRVNDGSVECKDWYLCKKDLLKESTMECVNPIGSVTESAKALLRVLDNPLIPEEIFQKLGQPLFNVGSSLREMSGAELIKDEGGRYIITEKGDDRSGGFWLLA